MKNLFFLFVLLLITQTAFSQPILRQQSYSNDTTYSTSSIALNDTSTTQDLLFYGSGTADFRLRYATYFNGAWSDTVEVDTVYSASGPFFYRITTLTNDSLKKAWLPFISPAPYYYSVLKAKSGWLFKFFVTTKASGNSGIISSEQL